MKRDKTKDMIRSVLPSTDRKGARHAKANRKRHVRRHVRQDLQREDFDEPKADLKLDARLSGVVWHRRGADKLNHFMRWCEAKTKGMDTDDALGYVRSILPSSLIGDHAYGHWKAHRMRHQFRFPYERPQSRQSYIDSTTFRLNRALGVAPDLHHVLNASIKREKLEGDPRRLLRGIHDVESFVRDVAWPDKRGEDDLFYIERRLTRDLIEKVEKGGREAALGVFPAASAQTLFRHPESPQRSGGRRRISKFAARATCSAFGDPSPRYAGSGRRMGRSRRARSRGSSRCATQRVGRASGGGAEASSAPGIADELMPGSLMLRCLYENDADDRRASRPGSEGNCAPLREAFQAGR